MNRSVREFLSPFTSLRKLSLDLALYRDLHYVPNPFTLPLLEIIELDGSLGHHEDFIQQMRFPDVIDVKINCRNEDRFMWSNIFKYFASCFPRARIIDITGPGHALSDGEFLRMVDVTPIFILPVESFTICCSYLATLADLIALLGAWPSLHTLSLCRHNLFQIEPFETHALIHASQHPNLKTLCLPLDCDPLFDDDFIPQGSTTLHPSFLEKLDVIEFMSEEELETSEIEMAVRNLIGLFPNLKELFIRPSTSKSKEASDARKIQDRFDALTGKDLPRRCGYSMYEFTLSF